MKKLRSKKRPTKTVFQNPAVVIALITGVLGLLGTLIARWPGPEPTEPPTLTAFASATSKPTETITVQGDTETPTATLPAFSTETLTLTPTPTPQPVSLTCLDGWWLYPGGLDFKEEGRDGCARANIPELGFNTSIKGFQVTREKFRNLGIFGISSPLPENVTEIRLNVTVRTLYTAELWIGLSNSKEFEGDTMILAVDPETGQQQFLPGSIRIYRNDFDTKSIVYDWSRLDPSGGQSNKPPYNYEIKFIVTGGDVEIWVNNVKLVSQIINFPRNLFLGFRNKSTVNSVTMNVTITDLQIETGN